MGAKFFVVDFRSTDRAAVCEMWKLVCRYERVRVSMSALQDIILEQQNGEVFSIDDDDALSVLEDGTVTKHIDDYFIVKDGKWQPLDLAQDTEFFSDYWTYGGIPFSMGEAYTYSENDVLPPCESEDDVMEHLQSQEKGVAKAVEFGGRTFIGGWAAC